MFTIFALNKRSHAFLAFLDFVLEQRTNASPTNSNFFPKQVPRHWIDPKTIVRQQQKPLFHAHCGRPLGIADCFFNLTLKRNRNLTSPDLVATCKIIPWILKASGITKFLEAA